MNWNSLNNLKMWHTYSDTGEARSSITDVEQSEQQNANLTYLHSSQKATGR